MKIDGFASRIEDTWGFYDIQDRVRDILDDQDYILDLDIGIAVLSAMEDNYDAGIGYSWDTIDYWYKELVKEDKV